jgi:hypothetical protein
VAKCGIPCHVLQANRLRSKPSSHTTVTSRGDGEPRDTDCSGALTCRGRPHAQVDWLVAKSRVRGGVRGPQSCLHTCGAMPARRGRLETKGVARDGATARRRTNVPCRRYHGSTVGSHTRSSHGDGGLRGMSGLGAPLYRGAAVLRLDGQHSGRFTWRRISTQPEHPGRDQGGEEVKTAVAALTLGRQCSRGRLQEDGWCSVVMHGGGVPALLRPYVIVPVRSLLGSGSLVTDGAPISSARRGRWRAPSSSPFLPLLLSRQWNREMGKIPKANGGRPAGGSGLGCRCAVKAVRGQRCCGAWGLDAQVR